MSVLTPLALQNAAILRAFRGTGRGGGQVIHNRHELADALKRDRSNLRKSIQTLAEAGLLIVEDHDSTLYVCRLTGDGEAAMAAIDRAEGIDTIGDAVPDGFVALRHDQIGPDPDNARKKSGLSAEAIAEMAESLLDKGILQQPGVRQNPDHDPADVASPSHLLTMGERRWRAWGLLIERGDWPASKTILCKLSDFDDAERLEAGLVENDQRADINNLERGEQYLVLHERHGRTPQQLARKVNRTSRFIQIAMKVAKEATAEAKAQYLESERAYAEGKAQNVPGTKRIFTWERLRDTVKTARYVTILEKRERITLLVAELALKVDTDPDATIVYNDDIDSAQDAETRATLISTPPGGGHWGEAQDLGLVIDHREDGQIYGGVTSVAREWLADAGFDKDPKGWTRALAIQALGSTMPVTLAEEAGKFITAFLNPPKPAPVETTQRPAPAVEDTTQDHGEWQARYGTAPPHPDEANAVREPEATAPPPRDSFADQIRQVNAESDSTDDVAALYTALGGSVAPPAETTAPPAEPQRDPTQLQPDEFLVLAEVAHKITTQGVEARGGAIRGAMTHNHHTGPHTKIAQALLHKRYLMFVQAPNAAGFMASLTQAGWDYFGGEVDDERLEGFRFENLSTDEMLAFEASGQRYATTWLQDPVKIAEPKPAESKEDRCAACDEACERAKAAGHRNWRNHACFDHAAVDLEDDELGSPFSEDGDDDPRPDTPDDGLTERLKSDFVEQSRQQGWSVYLRAIDIQGAEIWMGFTSHRAAEDVAKLLWSTPAYRAIAIGDLHGYIKRLVDQ